MGRKQWRCVATSSGGSYAWEMANSCTPWGFTAYPQITASIRTSLSENSALYIEVPSPCPPSLRQANKQAALRTWACFLLCGMSHSSISIRSSLSLPVASKSELCNRCAWMQMFLTPWLLLRTGQTTLLQEGTKVQSWSVHFNSEFRGTVLF